MLHFRNVINFLLLICTISTIEAKEKKKSSEPKEAISSAKETTRSQMSQLLQAAAQSEGRINAAEYNVSSSQKTNMVTLSMLMQGLVSKFLIFQSDVTVDVGGALIVHEADKLAVVTDSNDSVRLSAHSFSGITNNLHANLTLQSGASTPTFHTHTVINGSLHVKDNKIVEGNLTVNGGLIVDAGKTLTVHGALVCDGQCEKAFSNAGTITATRTITIQNCVSSQGGGRAVSNSGTLGLSSNGVINTANDTVVIAHNKATGTDGIAVDNTGTISALFGRVVLNHNTAKGINGIAVQNSGASALIENSGGAIHIEDNDGQRYAFHNTVSAHVATTKLGPIVIKRNVSSNGVAVSNNGASLLTTVDGDIHIVGNNGVMGAVVNMEDAHIKSTEKGSLFLTNNVSQSAIAISNIGTSSVMQVSEGNIRLSGNHGATTGVSNMSSAKIEVVTMGSIWFVDNYASGAAAILNDGSAKIETLAAGSIHFERNSGETNGVENNDVAEITAVNNIVFDGNHGRLNAGVLNDVGGIIQATSSKSLISFNHNIGADYGIHNHAAASTDRTQIRTTDTGSNTRIIFVGNSGSQYDTLNQGQAADTTSAAIVAGGTGTTGNGSICFDAQSNVVIGNATIGSTVELCAEIVI